MPIKNWWGENLHPTDKYIHWSEEGEKLKRHSEKIRLAYDKIKNAGLLEELKYLMEEAATKEKKDQAELNAGEDI